MLDDPRLVGLYFSLAATLIKKLFLHGVECL